MIRSFITSRVVVGRHAAAVRCSSSPFSSQAKRFPWTVDVCAHHEPTMSWLCTADRCEHVIKLLEGSDMVHSGDALTSLGPGISYEEMCARLGQRPRPFHWELEHDQEQVLDQTKDWVQVMRAVFPMWPYHFYDGRMDRAACTISTAATVKDAYLDYWQAAHRLAESSKERVPSSLVVFPQFTHDLLRFTRFTADNKFQLDTHVPEFTQSGLFHPQCEVVNEITMEVEEGTQAYKYWWRSPYPMLHIQRTEALSQEGSAQAAMGYHTHMTHVKAQLDNVGIVKLQQMLDAKDWSALTKLR